MYSQGWITFSISEKCDAVLLPQWTQWKKCLVDLAKILFLCLTVMLLLNGLWSNCRVWLSALAVYNLGETNTKIKTSLSENTAAAQVSSFVVIRRIFHVQIINARVTHWLIKTTAQGYNTFWGVFGPKIREVFLLEPFGISSPAGSESGKHTAPVEAAFLNSLTVELLTCQY